MTAWLLNHIWQSTLFAAGAGLLTLAFAANSAAVRYWLWFAASMKFLIPFSAVTALGTYLFQSFTPQSPLPILSGLRPAAEPFSGTAPALAAPALASPIIQSINWTPLLFAVWMLGFAVILAIWFGHWLKLRVALAEASPLSIAAPMPVKSSAASPEPRLIGIWQPVLLLPRGVETHLSLPEMRAILAHEHCHLRRRDNLLAAIHMMVQALFWFHPLVWWLGTRLIAERESACDEAVLASGSDPQTYAEGILKVCRFYFHSPLECASGVSGADLKKRIKTIMEGKFAVRLNVAKKGLLATCAATTIGAPLALGLLAAPPASALVAAEAPPSLGATAELQPAPQTYESVAKNIQAAPARRIHRNVIGPGTQSAPVESEEKGQEDNNQLGPTFAAAVESQVTRDLEQTDNLAVKSMASKSVTPDETEAAAAPASSPVASPAAAHGVRPEITQLLRQAQLLSNAIRSDKAAVMEKIEAAEAMPNLNRDEKNKVALTEANLFGTSSGVLVNEPFVGMPASVASQVEYYLPLGEARPHDPNG